MHPVYGGCVGGGKACRRKFLKRINVQPESKMLELTFYCVYKR